MTTFEMIRNNDESGVSGTGRVLSGCVFDSGEVVVCWDSASGINSLGFYKSYYDFYHIHVKSHPTNKTEVKFADDRPLKVIKDGICVVCGNLVSDHPHDIQEDKSSHIFRMCSGNRVGVKNNG